MGNNFFKEKVKIKELKNLTVPFVIALSVSGILIGATSFIDNKQDKQLDALERVLDPTDDQAKEYRAEIKRYFANYMGSAEAKRDFIAQTSMDSYIYDELSKNGFANMLSEEDIDEIIDLTVKELQKDPNIAYAGQNESVLYSTLYNKLLYQVRDKLLENDIFTVTQAVTYDKDKILQSARSQLSSTQERLNKQESVTTIEDVRNAYIADIVDNTLTSLVLTESEKNTIKTNVINKVTEYLESEEGKKLLQDGKDGKDGEDGSPINWSDKTVITLINKLHEELLDTILNDLSGEISIVGIDGASIDLDKTQVSVNMSNDATGAQPSIRLAWTRGDWENTKIDNKITFEVPSFDGMKIENNKNIDTVAMLCDIMSLSDENNDAFSTEGGTVTIQKGNVTQVFEMSTLVDAFAKTYLTTIYTEIENRPIGAIKDSNDAFLCAMKDESGNECGEALDAIMADDGQTVAYYSCPTHDIVAVSIEELFKQTTETLEVSKELLAVSDMRYSFDDYIDNSDDCETIDEAIEGSSAYILNMYNEILNAMDDGHKTGDSFFDIYCQSLADVNNELETAVNYYGFDSVMDSECLNAANTESVIVRHMIHEHYIERKANGTLEFVLPKNFDTTDLTESQIIAAKIKNAYSSPILTIIENYIEYANSIKTNGLFGQIEQWEKNLIDIMTLISLTNGDGYTVTIPKNASECVVSMSGDTKEILDKYVTAKNETVIPLKFKILNTNTPAEIHSDIINNIEIAKISHIYYEIVDDSISKIHIILKDGQILERNLSIKVFF